MCEYFFFFLASPRHSRDTLVPSQPVDLIESSERDAIVNAYAEDYECVVTASGEPKKNILHHGWQEHAAGGGEASRGTDYEMEAHVSRSKCWPDYITHPSEFN